MFPRCMTTGFADRVAHRALTPVWLPCLEQPSDRLLATSVRGREECACPSLHIVLADSFPGSRQTRSGPTHRRNAPHAAFFRVAQELNFVLPITALEMSVVNRRQQNRNDFWKPREYAYDSTGCHSRPRSLSLCGRPPLLRDREALRDGAGSARVDPDTDGSEVRARNPEGTGVPGPAHRLNMTWDLALFDCDGVLVDSEPIASRLFSVMLGEIGLPMTPEQALRQFMGCSMSTWVALIERRLGGPVPSGFISGFYARLDAAFRHELRPVPGILSALDHISVPNCVASNGSLDKIRTSLEITGLLPRFEGRLFSVTEVARGKPFPDLFLYAAHRMGATPAQCAVVEDSPLGVQAGIAAGMCVFGYARLAMPDTLAAAGARVFTDMEELPKLLQMASRGRCNVLGS